MKCMHVEYDVETGEITCIRTFDAETIPPQALAPGHAELILDLDNPAQRALANDAKRNPKHYLIDHRVGRLEKLA